MSFERLAEWLLGAALLLLAFMSLGAGVLGHRRGGITWRGVRYDAALLRSAQRFRR